MGDKAEALTKLGFEKDVANVFELADRYASLVADAFSAYSAAKSVLQFFGVIASDPSLQDIKVELDNIQNKLDFVMHDLEAEILGTARQQMRIDIANQASQSLISVNAAIGFTQNPRGPAASKCIHPRTKRLSECCQVAGE
jgi:hypothetical protein